MPERVTIWIVAGEESGDQLGAKLMRPLKARLAAPISLRRRRRARHGRGRGSRASSRSDIAVMGFTAVLARLPTILNGSPPPPTRWSRPSPTSSSSSTVRISPTGWRERVRRRAPRSHRRLREPLGLGLASRPRAAMRAYVDHLLALLPFEPEAHRRLGGPPTTYVGHPLIERLDEIRPAPARAVRWARTDRAPRPAGQPPLGGEPPHGAVRRSARPAAARPAPRSR